MIGACSTPETGLDARGSWRLVVVHHFHGARPRNGGPGDFFPLRAAWGVSQQERLKNLFPTRGVKRMPTPKGLVRWPTGREARTWRKSCAFLLTLLFVSLPGCLRADCSDRQQGSHAVWFQLDVFSGLDPSGTRAGWTLSEGSAFTLFVDAWNPQAAWLDAKLGSNRSLSEIEWWLRGNGRAPVFLRADCCQIRGWFPPEADMTNIASVFEAFVRRVEPSVNESTLRDIGIIFANSGQRESMAGNDQVGYNVSFSLSGTALLSLLQNVGAKEAEPQLGVVAGEVVLASQGWTFHFRVPARTASKVDASGMGEVRVFVGANQFGGVFVDRVAHGRRDPLNETEVQTSIHAWFQELGLTDPRFDQWTWRPVDACQGFASALRLDEATGRGATFST